MVRAFLYRGLAVAAVLLVVSAAASAQYPPGGGGGGGTGGSGGTYSAPSGGYSHAAIAGEVAGAAAAGALFLVLHNRPAVVGCVQSTGDGAVLTNEKDKRTYALVGDSTNFPAGQRVALKGKKLKDGSGKLSLQVQKVAKDYGPCK